MSAASCDTNRRRRASPHIRYSGSDNTSRATNIVNRSSAAPKIIMPANANIISGKISVCATTALAATFSATLPGTAAACGVKPSSPPPAEAGMRRSAASSTPRMPINSNSPCKNRAGRSTASEPTAALLPGEDPNPAVTDTTAASAAA